MECKLYLYKANVLKILAIIEMWTAAARDITITHPPFLLCIFVNGCESNILQGIVVTY